MSLTPVFLDLDSVLQLHAHQIRKYGGLHGLRDEGLLLSALAQPSAGFGEDYFHPDLPAMAAAYVFHLVKNHPFVDGNKRTGFACAVTFLILNGYLLPPNEPEQTSMVLGIAEGRLTKDQVIDWFRERVVG